MEGEFPKVETIDTGQPLADRANLILSALRLQNVPFDAQTAGALVFAGFYSLKRTYHMPDYEFQRLIDELMGTFGAYYDSPVN